MKFKTTTKKNILLQVILIGSLLVIYSLNFYTGCVLSVSILAIYGIFVITKYRENTKSFLKKLISLLIAILIAQSIFVATDMYKQRLDNSLEKDNIYTTIDGNIKTNSTPICGAPPYNFIKTSTFVIFTMLGINIIIFTIFKPHKKSIYADIFLFVLGLITALIGFCGIIFFGFYLY